MGKLPQSRGTTEVCRRVWVRRPRNSGGAAQPLCEVHLESKRRRRRTKTLNGAGPLTYSSNQQVFVPATSSYATIMDRVRKWGFRYDGGKDPLGFIERVEE
ncbi:unnamed protein product [Ceratitis capitata]|uniref:(Mediterranean fruit fly) hypothetical protein n=1 Tax=Ceratitis capitata TaxID=7213 RepID=A0A811V8X6_CERCA|nr:unnamed protein product [Ceratitis capitata]